MSTLPLPNDPDLERQRLIDDYLAKGGEVTVYPKGQRSENIEYTGGFYQRRKKKKEDADEQKK